MYGANIYSYVIIITFAFASLGGWWAIAVTGFNLFASRGFETLQRPWPSMTS
jgi:hypothetical protein